MAKEQLKLTIKAGNTEVVDVFHEALRTDAAVLIDVNGTLFPARLIQEKMREEREMFERAHSGERCPDGEEREAAAEKYLAALNLVRAMVGIGDGMDRCPVCNARIRRPEPDCST